MADVIELRDTGKDIIGIGFIVNDWADESLSAEEIKTLEASVLAIQEEASRLSALAKAHRMSL